MKYPSHWPSGEMNGEKALATPASGTAGVPSRRFTRRLRAPPSGDDELAAPNTSVRPSGVSTTLEPSRAANGCSEDSWTVNTSGKRGPKPDSCLRPAHTNASATASAAAVTQPSRTPRDAGIGCSTSADPAASASSSSSRTSPASRSRRVRIAPQAPPEYALHSWWRCGRQPRPVHVLGQHRRQRVAEGLALEEPPPCQHLPQRRRRTPRCPRACRRPCHAPAPAPCRPPCPGSSRPRCRAR